jgi:hypothetical protein
MHLTRFHGVFAPRHVEMTWAQRLKCVFDIQIDTCARRGGQLKVIASIEEPQVIAKILAHLQKRVVDQDQIELPRKEPARARVGSCPMQLRTGHGVCQGRARVPGPGSKNSPLVCRHASRGRAGGLKVLSAVIVISRKF